MDGNEDDVMQRELLPSVLMKHLDPFYYVVRPYLASKAQEKHQSLCLVAADLILESLASGTFACGTTMQGG